MDQKSYEWEILQVNEFNSTRKRMSALVRAPTGEIKLYIKGADTVIFERLAKQGNFYLDSTVTLLEEFANEGLRTLCIAYRNVSEQEYFEWSKIYEKAATTINNRGAELEKAAELIEKDLILLGATAIEDRLQDQVPDTIHTLASAGVKIWVLTGDRQETAINIGYSCKLITEEMSVILVNEATHYATKEFLEEKLAQLKGVIEEEERQIPWQNRVLNSIPYVQMGKFAKVKKVADKDLQNVVLVIDGKSLSYALEDDIKMIFLELAILCKAVICCRVSPLQKALVVKLVKKNVIGSVTLAIGDGANDVSMIQAAHVGVGISGLEGLQAARSADFAIAQFRFLRKLLLVHGSWSYSRMSKVVLYSYYKNIVLYLIQLWFSFSNGFSGQTLFETWTSSAYNIAFAFFQPMAIGIFDQFLNARMLDRYPKMYGLGQRNEFYNFYTFWGWILNSFFQSLIMYYCFTQIYGEGAMLANGNVMNNWGLGEMIYCSDLITITMKAALVVDTWTRFTYFALFGSIGIWFVLFPSYVKLGELITRNGHELTGLNNVIFLAPAYWLGILLVPIVANLRDYVWKV
jgi:phospholipid-transporting ATPase